MIVSVVYFHLHCDSSKLCLSLLFTFHLICSVCTVTPANIVSVIYFSFDFHCLFCDSWKLCLCLLFTFHMIFTVYTVTPGNLYVSLCVCLYHFIIFLTRRIWLMYLLLFTQRGIDKWNILNWIFVKLKFNSTWKFN